MRTYYTDGGPIPFGSLVSEEPKPRLIDAPIGSKVRIRFHQTDIAKAFISHANGTFSVWSLQWEDEKKRTLKLMYPIANTIRQ